MSANDMTVRQILNGGGNQLLIVSAADLLEVASRIGRSIAKEFFPQREERYLTIKEVSEMLKVDRSTLYRWDRDNYLKAVHFGGKKRYRLSDIERIMEVDRDKQP